MPTYTIVPDVGVYTINGQITGLLYNYRREVASDICKGANICQTIPVEIDCSLACTAIGWPQQYGYLFIELYRQPLDCPNEEWSASRYCPSISVFLECQPNDPVVDNGVWQGQTITDCIALSNESGYYGLTLQVCARMTVNENGTLSVQVEIKRIAPASDILPPPVDGLNQIVPCISFTKTLGWHNNTGEINTGREYTYPGGAAPNEKFDVVLDDPDKCPLDVKSVMMSVSLSPFPVGCNGTAEGYQSSICSLDTGLRTYSCFSALIKPATVGDFYPFWIQLGVNATPNSGSYGCLQGVNSDTTAIPPTAATLYPVGPFGQYPMPDDILNAGCAGEDPINGDTQQIQFASGGGYDIAIKSINKGGFCVIMRETGAGNPWTIGTSIAFNATIFNQTGHYIRTYEFPAVTGSPVAILYGLQFPEGITAQCVDEQNAPEMTPPVARMAPMTPSTTSPETDESKEKRARIRESVIQTRKKMDAVRENPCIYLGNPLETVASCGCSGGILHECQKHGTCRVSGNTKEMNCWRCDFYTPNQNGK